VLQKYLPLVPLYQSYLVSIAGRTDVVGSCLSGEAPEPRNEVKCSVLSEQMLVHSEAFNRREQPYLLSLKQKWESTRFCLLAGDRQT